MFRTILVVVLCCGVKAKFEGDRCEDNGVAGVCVSVNKCKSALQQISSKNRPKICSFVKENPIVCCVDITSGGVATTISTPSSTSTEYIPPTFDYETNIKLGPDKCAPLDSKLTSAKTGQKAWDKCLEYQEKFVFPCEKSTALIGGVQRKDYCFHNADELIVGGENAKKNEFRHMVLLGYDYNNSIQYKCGGSLISEKFVLTAGHCLTSREFGNVLYVSVGVLARSEVAPSNTYKVKTLHHHPQYRSGVYNDIAIIELEKPVELSPFIVPACLHVGDEINYERAIATGWGLLQDGGKVTSDVLQKVIINKFRNSECRKEYPESRKLITHVFDANTQICYGDRNAPKDTCLGDSGGPLQIKHKKMNCMYLIIGVTSGGRGCAWRNKPGLYSKVSHHLRWIESIVWP